eukprot:scaffold971_cov142-Skeletonema_menzelii.AAC.1
MVFMIVCNMLEFYDLKTGTKIYLRHWQGWKWRIIAKEINQDCQNIFTLLPTTNPAGPQNLPHLDEMRDES